MNLRVNEIFYSLQGEGARVGEASIFIRLSGCNLRCNFCDTEFEYGKEMSLEDIVSEISDYSCRSIVWTGGEPALQLTDEVITHFKKRGYFQAIETNGTIALPKGLDYVACSPKGSLEGLSERISKVDEFRFPIKYGDPLPDAKQLPYAKNLMISPIFDGDAPVQKNIDYCVTLVKENPKWRLSLQMHKLIGIK